MRMVLNLPNTQLPVPCSLPLLSSFTYFSATLSRIEIPARRRE